jgi:hypothetical protein
VKLKYHLERFHCHIPVVVKKFMKHFEANGWKEKLNVNEFLELEKQIYLDMFPHNKAIFDGEEEEDDTEMDSAMKKGEGGKKRQLEEVDISKNSSSDDDANASDDDGHSD